MKAANLPYTPGLVSQLTYNSDDYHKVYWDVRGELFEQIDERIWVRIHGEVYEQIWDDGV